jgi:hypothetical protein
MSHQHRSKSTVLGLLLLSAASLAAGCGHSADALGPEAMACREKFLLAEEPADVQGVLDARESLTALKSGSPGSADAGYPVAVVGQIGGVPDPWTKGQAAFMMIDPAAAASAGEHHHPDGCSEDCPFCSKNEHGTEQLAMVQFVDETGRVLPHDARRLFDLAPGQTVVVHGRAHIDDLGYLVITASGLYVRR